MPEVGEKQQAEDAAEAMGPSNIDPLAAKFAAIEKRLAEHEANTNIVIGLLAKLGEKSDMRLSSRQVPGGGLQLFWKDGARIVLP